MTTIERVECKKGGSFLLDYKHKKIILESEVDYSDLSKSEEEKISVAICRIAGNDVDAYGNIILCYPSWVVGPTHGWEVENPLNLIGCFLHGCEIITYEIVGEFEEDKVRYFVNGMRCYVDMYRRLKIDYIHTVSKKRESREEQHWVLAVGEETTDSFYINSKYENAIVPLFVR